jgi:glutamate synthase domain-containing protein 3
MTGGRVVVLGPTGRNFGAGMSGGIAYVFDPHDVFAAKVNPEMVQLQQLDDDDREFVRDTVQSHFAHTDSVVAAAIIEGWETEVAHFKKVMPIDYARVLSVMKQADVDGLDEQQTSDRIMEAARG